MHKKFFFITGLPRTRTAWLSNLLSSQNMYCYHEAIRMTTDMEDLRDIMIGRLEHYIGTSCSILPYYIDELARHIPDFKLIIIRRNIDEVEKSLGAAFGSYKSNRRVLEDTEKRIDEMAKNYQHLSISYNDLDNIDVVCNLWKYINKTNLFDFERCESLLETKVEVIPEKYIKNFDRDVIFQIANKVGEAINSKR